MDLIYHYTNASALLGMFKNCSQKNPYITMWATHALYLNDPTEYRYGKEVCHKLLQAVEEELGIPEIDRLSVRMYEEQMQDHFKLIDMAYAQEPRQIGRGYPYVISFSKNRDTLSMWNTYAQRGNGIAIGFDKDELQRRCKQLKIKSCYYDIEDKDYSSVKNEIKRKYGQYQHRVMNDPAFAPIDFMQYLHSEFAAYTKHKAYIEEREVRCKINQSDGILFREANGMVVPYVETKIPFECVKELIVGPTIDKDRMNNSLFMLLASKKCKHGVQIEMSKIPYRG